MTTRVEREKISAAEGKVLAKQHESARATVEDKIDARNSAWLKAGKDAARSMAKKLSGM